MKKILYAGIAILLSLSSLQKTSANSLFMSSLSSFLNLAQNDGVSLVLIGLVCKKDGMPLENVKVQLLDKVTNQTQSFYSKEDGQFYFQLESDKQYDLFCVNAEGKMDDVKTISTVNKKDPEILRAVLELTEDNAPGNQTLVYNIERPAEYASSIDESGMDDKKLIFKIQIGAFRHKLSENASFIQGFQKNLTTENAPNGFTRYLVGTFEDIREAENFEKVLHYKGYDKAYIVTYEGGQRLSLSLEDVIRKYKLK